jgi:DNA-binding SARP family transcriptional activator
LLYDGRLLTTLNTTRLQSFLVYLLLHKDALQPRRHLAFLFWPDTSETQALTNLRTLYARLRQKLPHADLFLASNAQTIQWRPESPFTLDVAAFVTAVTNAQTAADWRTAVELYRGPLLPHWYDE